MGQWKEEEEAALTKAKSDIAVHMAGASSPGPFFKFPQKLKSGICFSCYGWAVTCVQHLCFWWFVYLSVFRTNGKGGSVCVQWREDRDRNGPGQAWCCQSPRCQCVQQKHINQDKTTAPKKPTLQSLYFWIRDDPAKSVKFSLYTWIRWDLVEKMGWCCASCVCVLAPPKCKHLYLHFARWIRLG